jgi:chitin disaccharide deacetylase
MPGSPGSTFIITADDLGYTNAINRGILAAFAEGSISHASLMVNMPFTDEAVEMARQARVGERIGVHLNLADGAPLTEAMRACPRFCRDGRFIEPLTRNRFWPLTGAERRILAGEVRAQIAAVRDRGFAGRYLDSHRYVHTAPNVARVVVRVAREMRVARVRPFQNCGPAATGIRMLGKSVFNGWLASAGLKRVDYFGSIDDLKWQAAHGGGRITSAEVMTHPHVGSDGVVMDGSSGPLRQRLLELESIIGARLVASDSPLRYDK